MKFLISIAPLAEQYDAYLLDLWGVIHDGIQLYPGVKECLEHLREQQKKILFLSNAPRRSATVAQVLATMGIGQGLYDGIVTSGETAYQNFAHPETAFFKPQGKHYFYIGLEKDRRMLDGLDYVAVENPGDSQFVLLSHSYYDNQPLEELMPLLKEALGVKMPVVCINPDREVVRLSGGRVYCAGIIAEAYEQMGGEVVYFGKPHPVYEACMQQFSNIPKPKILAIGDSLGTDIKGANAKGIASALVTGGILSERLGAPETGDYRERCLTLFETENIKPDFVISRFNW